MKNLTPNQAHYVLSALVAQGRVRASQVEKALMSRDEEIRSLRDRLATLESLATERKGVRGPRRRKSRGRPAGARKAGRRAMSPRVIALRRQQGRYMGYVRRLKPAEKGRVRIVREKEGIEAAIKLASSLGSKS